MLNILGYFGRNKQNSYHGYAALINFRKVAIAVDILMEKGNEFLQSKIPSGRSFGIRRLEDN